MRLVHTSDWHLGRLLHGVSLLEDQRAVLERLLERLAADPPDGLIIAGDVYDRAVPPREAVELLDATLHRIVLELGIPTFMIAGNHDSGERLGFGSSLLESRGLFIEGPIREIPRVVPFVAKGVAVDIALIPYAAPEIVRSVLDEDELRGHEATLRELCERALVACEDTRPKLVVAHAFVTGAEVSDSERDLVVGGSGAVPASVFEGFDYVALGHLHRPQRVGEDRVRYSGSLLKYSFSEEKHDKGYTEVRFDADGLVGIEHRPLRGPRDLRRIEGTLRELLEAGPDDPARDDYVLARITDPGLLFNAMAQLRGAYPNALHIERPIAAPAARGAASRQAIQQRSPLELFESFYREMRGEDAPLTEAQRAIVKAAIERVEAREGERKA